MIPNIFIIIGSYGASALQSIYGKQKFREIWTKVHTHTHIQKPDTIHATKTQENSSLVYSLFYSPILSHSLGSFTHSIIYLLNHSLTNLLTYSPISLFPHLLTHVTHSLTHSPVTHSLLTHSLLTHSLLTHSLLTHCSLTRPILWKVKPPWPWWFT